MGVDHTRDVCDACHAVTTTVDNSGHAAGCVRGNLIAIDPGLDTGWGLVSSAGALLAAGLGWPSVEILRSASRAVLERPRVYPGRQQKGDPNDLITLAIQLGRYLDRLDVLGIPNEVVAPRDWKGTVDADVLCRRVYAALSEQDRQVLDPVLRPISRIPLDPNNLVGTLTKGKRHNVIDGVGIARWAVGSRLTARFNVAPSERVG